MNAARADVREAGGGVGHLVLDREAPVSGVGGLDVGIDGAQGDVGQRLRCRCAVPNTPRLLVLMGVEGWYCPLVNATTP